MKRPISATIRAILLHLSYTLRRASRVRTQPNFGRAKLFFFPPSLSLSSFFPPVLAAACFFFERVSIQGGEAASSGMRQAQSCVTNWATPAQIMGVLFGERGNSFISFFQQSAAGQHGATATEGRGWIVQPRIKRNYIAFVSSDRKQLRVNKRVFAGYGRGRR